ncbi:DMT family transporter, partial [bacterium]|nr:DMT family transporter [bacterium]
MTNDIRFLPRLAAIAAVVLFSTGGLAIKSVALPPLAISGARSGIAALALGLYIFVGLKQKIRFDLGRSGWAAAVFYFLSLTAYVTANKWTTAANTIFLEYTMPAWVLIFGAVWLGERATWGRIISVMLSLGGLAVFFLEDVEPQQWLGNMTAVFAGVTFAFVVLTLRRNRERGAIH